MRDPDRASLLIERDSDTSEGDAALASDSPLVIAEAGQEYSGVQADDTLTSTMEQSVEVAGGIAEIEGNPEPAETDDKTSATMSVQGSEDEVNQTTPALPNVSSPAIILRRPDLRTIPVLPSRPANVSAQATRGLPNRTRSQAPSTTVVPRTRLGSQPRPRPAPMIVTRYAYPTAAGAPPSLDQQQNRAPFNGSSHGAPNNSGPTGSNGTNWGDNTLARGHGLPLNAPPPVDFYQGRERDPGSGHGQRIRGMYQEAPGRYPLPGMDEYRYLRAGGGYGAALDPHDPAQFPRHPAAHTQALGQNAATQGTYMSPFSTDAPEPHDPFDYNPGRIPSHSSSPAHHAALPSNTNDLTQRQGRNTQRLLDSSADSTARHPASRVSRVNKNTKHGRTSRTLLKNRLNDRRDRGPSPPVPDQ